jgi:hypothetical protein
MKYLKEIYLGSYMNSVLLEVLKDYNIEIKRLNFFLKIY